MSLSLIALIPGRPAILGTGSQMPRPGANGLAYCGMPEKQSLPISA